MDRMEMFKKSCMTGILCSLMYHMTLMLVGEQVSIAKAILFTGVFVVLYFLWLLLVSVGRKG